MFLQKLDKYFFRWRWIIYLFGVFFIIYFDKFDLNLVFKICINIFLVTILWIIFVFIPRYYFLYYIKNFNIWLLKNYPIFLKLRYEIINLPYLLKIIVSYFLYIDRLLRIIFFIGARHDKVFYFIRLLIYLNLYLWLLLPFYLIIKFLYNIYYFILLIDNNILSIWKYLILRVDFVIISIIFMLLFGISRIDFIILIWVIDEIINLYYLWILNLFFAKKQFLQKYRGNLELNIFLLSDLIYEAFINLDINFKVMFKRCNELDEKRVGIMLLFLGLIYYEELNFFYKKNLMNYWNTKLFKQYDYIIILLNFYYELNDRNRFDLYIGYCFFDFYFDFDYNFILNESCNTILLNIYNVVDLNNLQYYFEYRFLYLSFYRFILKLQKDKYLYDELKKIYIKYEENMYLMLNYINNEEIMNIIFLLKRLE